MVKNIIFRFQCCFDLYLTLNLFVASYLSILVVLEKDMEFIKKLAVTTDGFESICELAMFVKEAYLLQQSIANGRKLTEATQNTRLMAVYNSLLPLKREETEMHRFVFFQI